MTIETQSLAPATVAKGDVGLMIIASATILLSVTALIAGHLGLMPSDASVLVILVGAVITLRVAWAFVAKAASSSSRARVAQLASTAGLIISTVSLIAALPRVTKGAGFGVFLEDCSAQVWTAALLTVITAPLRTLSWRAFAGAFLTGFLGITGIGRLLARPLVVKLGTSSVIAVGLWTPVTEEICKLIPFALVLFLATRRANVRPSALELTLLAAWTAAGFAVYENATYGRGWFSLSAMPPFSWLFPMELKGSAYGWAMLQSGHTVHTALIALAVAFVVLYGRRIHGAWIAPAVAIGAVLLEHCGQNSIITGNLNDYVGEASLWLTCGGRLTSILLIVGVGYAAILEWRVVGIAPVTSWQGWFRLTPSQMQRRLLVLGAAQTRGMTNWAPPSVEMAT